VQAGKPLIGGLFFFGSAVELMSDVYVRIVKSICMIALVLSLLFSGMSAYADANPAPGMLRWLPAAPPSAPYFAATDGNLQGAVRRQNRLYRFFEYRCLRSECL
jgi:hypothetical protein